MNHSNRERFLWTLSTYGLASLLVGAANSVQVAARLSDQLRLWTRLRILGYDLALSLLLGGGVAITVWCWDVLSRRWIAGSQPRATIVAQAVFGGCLGGLCLTDDLANFVGRQDWQVPPAGLGILAGVVANLGTSLMLRRTRGGWSHSLAALTAAFLASNNAAILPGAYPGFHLLIALLSLVLFASVLSSWLPRRIRPMLRVACPSCVLVASAVPFLAPPSRIVRQNLNASSGSAAAPFITRWLPQAHGRGVRRLLIEQTEWFKPRSASPAILPNSVPLLAANGAVLFLTIEALRSDVIEGRKQDRSLPNLARIRDAALRFTNARSPTPSTLTTVTSILTGKYYSQVYFTEHAPGKVNPITDRSTRVPELLSRTGVRTVNVRAMWGLGPRFGVGRGFDEAPMTDKDFGRVEQAMDIILAQLSRLKQEPRQRLFLFSHFVDSHAPYNLGGKRATPYESYIAELELVDRQLGRLFDHLDANQLTSRCLLIVSSDHGEAFGEHGTKYHASTVYDELLRVPLMFIHPALRNAALDLPVTLIDVSATLLDLFGVATPGDFMGQSLVPILVDRPAQFTRLIAADSGRRKQALFFDDGVKVLRDLRSGTVQVFDLRKDPKELVDLTDDAARDVEPYILATERFFEIHTLRVPGWKPPWRSF